MKKDITGMISSNGVKILTGEKLYEIRQRISAAFEAVRQPQAVAFEKMLQGSSRKSVLRMSEQSNICKDESGYTPTEFDRQAQSLIGAARSSHISTGAARNGVWNIVAPHQSASDLIEEACGPAKTESRRGKRSS